MGVGGHGKSTSEGLDCDSGTESVALRGFGDHAIV
jgi:hypothetical protein